MTPSRAAAGGVALAARVYTSCRNRHRSTVNVHLHLAGMAMCVASVALAALGDWLTALCLIAAGGCLQIIGHLAEGTRTGASVLFRLILRRQ